MGRQIFTFAALFVLILPRCQALDAYLSDDHEAIKRSNISSTTRGLTDCGFVGNNDIYGIGIRVGYYTQTLSVWVANYFVASEAKLLRSVNLLFLFAVFLGLVWLCHIPSQTHAIEAHILLTLLIATWHIGVLDNSRFSKKHFKHTPMTSFIRILTMCSVSAFYFWYWWFGLSQMQRTPCGTFVWVIIRLSLYGWIRIANQVVAACFLITVFWMHLGDIVHLVHHLRVTNHASPEYFRELRESLQKLSCNARSDFIPLPLDWTDPAFQALETGRETNDSSLHLAIDIALPSSPRTPSFSYDFGSQGPETPSEKAQGNHQLPCLADIIEAERYVQSVLHYEIRDHSVWVFEFFQDTPWVFRFYMKRLHLPKYYWDRLTGIIAMRPLRFEILIPVVGYLSHLEWWDDSLLPTMIETAINTPCHKTVSPAALHTILAFRTAELPATKRIPNVILSACWSMLMFLLMVVGIELSLVWNQIRGMGNIGTVGQLIPAILGSGGLIRVLWIWWSSSSGYHDDHEQFADGHELGECMNLYEELKQQRSQST